MPFETLLALDLLIDWRCSVGRTLCYRSSNQPLKNRETSNLAITRYKMLSI